MLRELFPFSARLPKTCSSAIFSIEEGVGLKTLLFVSVTEAPRCCQRLHSPASLLCS